MADRADVGLESYRGFNRPAFSPPPPDDQAHGLVTVPLCHVLLYNILHTRRTLSPIVPLVTLLLLPSLRISKEEALLYWSTFPGSRLVLWQDVVLLAKGQDREEICALEERVFGEGNVRVGGEMVEGKDLRLGKVERRE